MLYHTHQPTRSTAVNMSLTVLQNHVLPQTMQLKLRSAYGPVYRNVSVKPPRECTLEEIRIIDLLNIDKDYESRKIIAKEVGKACENSGFFYVKNHGISKESISRAKQAASKSFPYSQALSQVFLTYAGFLISPHV